MGRIGLLWLGVQVTLQILPVQSLEVAEGTSFATTSLLAVGGTSSAVTGIQLVEVSRRCPNWSQDFLST